MGDSRQWRAQLTVVMEYWNVSETVASQYLKAFHGQRGNKGRHMAAEALKSAGLA